MLQGGELPAGEASRCPCPAERQLSEAVIELAQDLKSHSKSICNTFTAAIHSEQFLLCPAKAQSQVTAGRPEETWGGHGQRLAAAPRSTTCSIFLQPREPAGSQRSHALLRGMAEPAAAPQSAPRAASTAPQRTHHSSPPGHGLPPAPAFWEPSD